MGADVRRRRFWRLAAGLVLVAALAQACGGGSSKSTGASGSRLELRFSQAKGARLGLLPQGCQSVDITVQPDNRTFTGTDTTVSLLLLTGFVLFTGRTDQVRIERSSLKFFVAAALVAVIAQVLNFIALGRGQLSVIIPLLNTTPLFAVFFSLLFLRGIEKVNTRIVLGALLMVGGIVLITSR